MSKRLIENPQTMGERLANARMIKGWSQERLARKSNVTMNMISKIERDQINPSTLLMARIIKALDISFDYIVFGKE